MSPDWANGASAVPYADFSDPQTLNLYAYVRNNPIANSDPIGHNIIADGLEQRDVWGASSGITSGDSARAAAVALNTSIAAGLEAAADAAAQQQQPQTLSPAGLRFIECHEAAGCQPNLTVYDASGKKGLGDWTVGYGHKVKAGEDFSKDITAEQAADLLRADVQTAVNAVNRALKSPTTFQSQFDAMVSLAYNIGGGAFAKSTLVTRWNSGGVVEQADLFTRWSRTGGAFSRGLYARREEEYTMFNTGRYP
jgi:lysozyme